MAQAGRAQEKPSLYERLGGVYGIATVVDGFIKALVESTRGDIVVE